MVDNKVKVKMCPCCVTCGLPTNMPRQPVILDNNILSYIEYEENRCPDCGHMRDGSTLPMVYDFWQDMARDFIKQRKDLIKFMHHYNKLSKEERKEVCLELPRYMRENYKPSGLEDDEALEPYSWNVVYLEVVQNTRLAKVMVRDIEWDKVKD